MYGNEEFGRWVRDCRNRLRLTQEQLAEKLNYTPEMIRSIERGRRKPADPMRIVDFFISRLSLSSAEREQRIRQATTTDNVVLKRLHEKAVAWHQDADVSRLAWGRELEGFLELRSQALLPELEARYLEACIRAEAVRLEKEREQVKRNQSVNYWRTISLVLATLVLMIGVVFGVQGDRNVNTTFFMFGSGCIVAAIIGSSFKITDSKFTILSSKPLQLALTGGGVVLVVFSFLLGNQQQIFNYPEVDGLRLDWCYGDGTECGRPAALAWCETQGFNELVSYEGDYAVNQRGVKTRVLGTGDICFGGDNGRCDSFISITCRK
jgi:transcriptional regulator with XRE-family HTH domain